MVGFSRLYCSILETTAGVATLGLDPPIRPGGRRVPVTRDNKRRFGESEYTHSQNTLGWFRHLHKSEDQPAIGGGTQERTYLDGTMIWRAIWLCLLNVITDEIVTFVSRGE